MSQPPSPSESSSADGVFDISGEAPRTHRKGLLLLMLFRIFRSVAAGMMTVALPYLMLSKLGYGTLTLGALYTSGVASTALLSLGLGQLADRWSRKGALLVGGAMVPISALMVYQFHSLPLLFAAAIIGGFSATGSLNGGGLGGAVQPVQTAVVADLTDPRNRTSYFSLLSFLSGLAGGGGALLARYLSIRGIFLAGALVSALGLLAAVPLHVPRAKRVPIAPARSKRIVRQFATTGALNGFAQGLVTPFLIPFFFIVYRMSRQDMAVYAAVATLLGSLSLLAAPLLERRLGFVRSITFTRALGASLLVLLAVWHNLDVALLIYVLTPALRIAAVPAQQTALTSRVDHKSLGRALSINQVTRLSASSSAILCTGYLFETAAIELPFFLFAATMSVNVYLYYRFFGRDGSRGVRPAEITPSTPLPASDPAERLAPQ